MSDWLRDGALVGAGGFLGALGRFLVSGWFQARTEHFPYGTLAVNLIGSLALGFLVTALAGRVLADNSLRLLAMVGFLGAFTTFSAFSHGDGAALAGRPLARAVRQHRPERRRLPAGHRARDSRSALAHRIAAGSSHGRSRARAVRTFTNFSMD